MVNHDCWRTCLAAGGYFVDALVSTIRVAAVALAETAGKGVGVLLCQLEPGRIAVFGVQRQEAKAGPGRIAGVHLLDPGLQVVAAQRRGPEGGLRRVRD